MLAGTIFIGEMRRRGSFIESHHHQLLITAHNDGRQLRVSLVDCARQIGYRHVADDLAARLMTSALIFLVLSRVVMGRPVGGHGSLHSDAWRQARRSNRRQQLSLMCV